ncbi:hypothetical protein HQ545_02410 [Candidatus Woesearchaeota archaeon]|nr:hypothetical protein [Candidatus Woesearchaeota archaeon]
MAEESKNPLYEQHKKYHDLVGKLQKIDKDKQTTMLKHTLGEVAWKYLNKNHSDGKILWSEKGEEEHRKFSDDLWENAAERIAKDYLNKSDDQIKELRKQVNEAGGSEWETLMSSYMGGLDKEHLWEDIKTQDEFTLDTISNIYVKSIAGKHSTFRRSEYLKKQITTPEDMGGIEEYLKVAKKHNKEALRQVKFPKKMKGLEDAIGNINLASQLLPDQYHPDKKDTYN